MISGPVTDVSPKIPPCNGAGISMAPLRVKREQDNSAGFKQDEDPMTVENDIVLIYIEDTPASFARVETIEADSKKDWFQIKLLMLQVPVQVVTWILKDIYINGEAFFMGGKKMRLEVVECPEEEKSPAQVPFSDNKNETSGNENESETRNAEIISFAELKKAKQKKENE